MRLLIIIPILLLTFVGYSQENNDLTNDSPFKLRFGLNLVDSSGANDPFDWMASFNEAAFSNPFELGAEYRFNDLFAVGLDGSINKWKGGDAVIDGYTIPVFLTQYERRTFAEQYRVFGDLTYFAVDAKLKLYVDEALNIFEKYDWLELYVEAGLGYFKVTEGGFTGNVGMGGNIWLTESLGLYLEGVGKFAFDQRFINSNHFQYSAGVQYRFGKKNQPEPIAEVTPEPEQEPIIINVDSDNDGVTDNFDNCPDIPGAIENYGCPKVLEVAEEIKEEEVKSILYLSKSIFYETGKSKLKEESFIVLNQITAILQQYPSEKISIIGHTDSTGSQSTNNSLSIERAVVVKDYFVRNGLSQNPITTDGRGSSEPIASNLSVEGRSKNRRTEIIVGDQTIKN